MAIYLYLAAEDHDYSSTEYSKTSARHLMLLLTKFCSQNLNTLLSEVLLKTGLAHI